MINYIVVNILLFLILSFIVFYAYIKVSKKIQLISNQYNESNANLLILQNVYNYIGHELNLETLSKLICDILIGIIGLSSCSIVLDNSKDEEAVIYSYPKRPYYLPLSYLKEKYNEHISGKLASQEKTLIQNQLSCEEHSMFTKNGTNSFAIVCLCKNNNYLGFLLLEHSSTNYFDQVHESLIRLLLNYIVTTINNAIQYEKIQKLSLVDGLTLIYNRMYFEKVYSNMLSQAMKTHSTLAVCFFDIDNFKSFNDAHGHLLADKQLVDVANLGNMVAKQHGGIIARYGGEEFVILIPNKSLIEVEEIIKNLREQIYLNTLVTASFGISMYLDTPTTPDILLSQADLAMYNSKQSGRNRVCIFNKMI